PAQESDLGSGAHFGPTDVVVIAEPRSDDTTLAEVGAMLDAPTVLLALPKREGKADPKEPGWIGEDKQSAAGDVQQVLRLVDKDAKVVGDSADSWSVSNFGDATPALRHIQLIKSAKLRPLLAGPDGMLIGERREGGRRVVVLSDPDLIANHGIARGDNAEIL